MFIGLGMPIPDLSNKPGPGRPGWGPVGSYDFKFEVNGAVTIKAQPYASGQSFTIQWPDGSTQTTTGGNSIAAPNATAGVVSINNELDSTYCDDFQVVGGQDKVLKVLSWGKNAWSNVFEAFKDCVNLTDISTTSFLASGQGPSNNQGCYMTKMFDGCTSLLEVDIRNWDLTAGVSWKTGSPFNGLVNLEKIDATGLKIKFHDNQSYARYWFSNVGSSTTNGCEFKLSGLDYSSTTNTYMVIDNIFSSVKFKDGSDLSNWVFPSHANSTYIYWFNSARISGTLDMSGWTTFNGSSLESMFYRFNQHLTAADGSKFNMSNWGFTYATSFYRMFWECEISEVIGFNTWGATSGSAVNLRNMFHAATLMRINPSDNFSNAFSSSLNVDNVRNMCQQFSSGLADADIGPPPSFAGADFSNMTNSFAYMFQDCKITNSPDFTTCTFSASNPVGFNAIFYNTTITDTNNHFILNNTNLAISDLYSAFFNSEIRKVTIGDNVDLSNLTRMGYMSYATTFDAEGLTLPSNADYSSLNEIGTYAFVNNALSTCQVDTFIRRNWATNLNTGLTCDLKNNKITAAPSIARSNAASLTSVRSWNITLGSPDSALPFAYASYAVDPTGITTISPTTTPPAGSVFTATNSLSIDPSTGVITIGSFRGGSTIKCTYPDGCYNEVGMTIMVPFQVDVTINSNTSYIWGFNPQMSAGECFVDWGDTNSETVTGSITHTYANTGGDATYSVKIFDSPSGSKFTGFDTWNNTYINNGGNLIDIKQWGEIQWQNNIWFKNELNVSPYYLQLQVSCASNDAPDLSQVTSLSKMFMVGSNRFNYAFTDPNNSLASWDVSTITDMSYMFAGIGKNGSVVDNGNFDTNLNSWDVSNVTDMSGLARLARGYSQHRVDFFCDQWDVSNVTNFNSTFYSASGGTVANRDLSNWNTSSATNMGAMFYNNSPGPNTNLLYKVVNAGQASEYKAWDVSNVTNFASMFYGSNLGTQGVYNWKINSSASANVGMASMFQTCSDLNAFIQTDADHINTKQETVGSETYTAWNMSRVSSLSNFAYNSYTTPYNPDLTGWSLGNVTTMSGMFYDNNPYISNPVLNRDISNWKPVSVTNMSNFYRNAQKSPIAMDRANYDLLLDIASGWGSVASSMQSGVSLNMGTSKFTGNNVVVGTATVNGTGTNLIASGSPFSSSMVGGIVTLTSGTNNGEQAKITNFNSSSSVTISRSINLPAEQNTFTVDTTDAAKGRFALSDPDGPAWIITDGGKEIVFDPFKIQVRVPNGGLSFSFAKIMSPSNVSATINWGDGQSSTISAVNSIPTHTYTNSTGSDVVYEIELNQGSDSVPCTGFRFDDNLDATSRAAVENITQWGSTSWVSMASAFKTCSNLDVTATDGPIITNSTNLTHTFGSCTSLVNSNGSIGNWDVSQLTGMYVTFDSCTNFNVDISKWNTSSLGNLQNTFQNCTSFNQDLSTKYITAGSSPTGSAYWAWNTSSVSNMIATFKGTTNFNCGSNANGLSNWNTSSATSMYEMFESSGYNRPLNTNLVPAASSYSGSDYVAWDVDNVSDFREMFRDNTSFNQDISKWKFKSTGTIAFNYMLKGATAFAQDISTKTITAGNSPYGTQYTAWDVSRASSLTRVIAGTNVNVLLNWNVGQWSQYALHSWGGATASGGGLSSANYTDQIVKWANDVNAAGKSPTGIYAIVNSDGAVVPAYDSTRTYGSGFANAGRARSYLSLDVSVSGLTGYNGTYYYDYATGQYVNESDSTLKFVYNTGESVWELHNEEGAQYAGTGGSQANGPTSATWSGFTVADASAGWSFNGTVTT